jgi:hypothetical protein
MEERMAALDDTIARNGAVIDDATFRSLLRILPAPNSLANIIELAKTDPEYNEALREQGVFIFASDKGDAGTPRNRGEIDPWVERMVDLGAEVTSFYDHVEADQDAPGAIIEAARGWADKLNGAADIVAFRRENAEVSG